MRITLGQHIKADGTQTLVKPKNGEHFSYEELRGFVGGNIEIVTFPSGLLLVVNEEGKLDGLPKNEEATKRWKQEFPIAEYPHNNDELIVGDALICPSDLIQ